MTGGSVLGPLSPLLSMSSELITDPLSPEAQSTQPTPPDVFIMYQKDFEKNHPDLVKLVMFDNNERYKLQCALWRFESADVRDEYWKMCVEPSS